MYCFGGGVITFNKVRTIASVKKEGDGIYSMTYYGDLKIDSLLSSDISTTAELMNWIIKEQFYGISLTVNENNFGCATFVCNNADGDVLMGRNFDYRDTDTVVIHTNPKNGYASYSLADLTVLGVGEDGIRPESLEGRAYMMATPYVCLNGVNEAGLAVVVEWLDGEMMVNELCAATNSVLTPGEHFDEGDSDNRISIIKDTLERNKYVLTEDEARDLLEAVSQNNFTEWSCVYNLDRFEVDVYMDTDYGTVYSFGKD